jgi:hypothetical protein
MSQVYVTSQYQFPRNFVLDSSEFLHADRQTDMRKETEAFCKPSVGREQAIIPRSP